MIVVKCEKGNRRPEGMKEGSDIFEKPEDEEDVKKRELREIS